MPWHPSIHLLSSSEEISEREHRIALWTRYDEMTASGVQMHFYRKPKRFGDWKKLRDKN